MSYAFGGKFQVSKLKDGGQERLRMLNQVTLELLKRQKEELKTLN